VEDGPCDWSASCRAVLKSRNMFCKRVLRHSNPGKGLKTNKTNLVENTFHSRALRTNNGGSDRDWQVIDYSVTIAGQFSQV
jgi:hypothetical protein